MTGISGITSSALAGMTAQTSRLSAVASNVANADTVGYRRLGTELSTTETGGVAAHVSPDDHEGVDLATEVLELTEAELAYKANATVFEAGADLWDVLSVIKRE